MSLTKELFYSYVICNQPKGYEWIGCGLSGIIGRLSIYPPNLSAVSQQLDE